MMYQFDKEIKNRISKEDIPIPDMVYARTEETLESLPERKVKRQVWRAPRAVFSMAACLLAVFLIFLPNVSVVYAQTAAEIPIIGKLIEVFTFRNYTYSDDRHELDAEVPMVENPENSQAGTRINQEVEELTDAVIQQFYQELEISGGKGYGSVHVDYEIVTNTEEWFTLKLIVSETAASSNTYARFYHIDRTTGEYVTFGDLFDSQNFPAIEQLILEQMKEEMAADEEKIYWVDETEVGEDITMLESVQNFYFNDKKELVIVYNKYEVGPGYMGCPEFEISVEDYEGYLKTVE